jgi:hypothetical protein
MDELVQRLSAGDHPVEISLRSDRTIDALKQQIDRGYVHIKFTGTRGGTEIGVQLDKDACELDAIDFAQGTGRAKFVGDLTLNYVKVRCIADIDVSTFEGSGRLQPIGDATASVPADATIN